MQRAYEIAIIGGGPAGLTAGLYAARATRATVCIERRMTGGQIALTSRVENYPGFPEGIGGYDLAQLMETQAVRYGMDLRDAEVTALGPSGEGFRIATSEGEFTSDAVIITTGADYLRLNIPGEERLTGRGVSYCATCDAAFFKDQTVAVVGGGDAALDEGLFVARYARRVLLIHRRDQLRASKVLRQRAFADPKFEFVWDSVVEEIVGDDSVTGVHVRNVRSGDGRTLDVSAAFIFIGQQPNSRLLDGLAGLDEGGHVVVDHWMRTDVPGLFAAGDVRAESSRQLVSAAGDGATAAIAADHYLDVRSPKSSPAGSGSAP